MRYLGRRLLAMIPALFGVLICVFLLTRVLPGDPARTLAGEQADPETVQRIRDQMGLDKPLWSQFVTYLSGVFHGDLGTAWHTGRPVLADLASRFPATVELALVALVIALVLGIPLGIISAVHRGRWVDHLGRIIGLTGASMPLFWLGMLVIYVFYFLLDVAPAPVGRLGDSINPPTHVTGLYLVDSLLSGDTVAFGSAANHIIWPALVLSTGALAMFSRMTRSAMLEILGQDYVRTAVSKGLRPRSVIGKHSLKNAAPPVLTVVGLELGQLLAGAVLTETIFTWPGIGSYITQSILATDYAPIQAFTLLAAVLYLVINLAVDLAQAAIDPRIRHAR
ncbi:ABC transporter permease [Brachybacterium huguangmaarense]|uniref:ABC transporter permease n=1 Tax=Brachybacterium huguangmaarense TaxID=1652028 RepID=A0ABY6G2L4_9MICO|nr:ABC transporter permease [Brachybacterium huguangmaarense]UYG16888.1 ABC transporter permease [Brachybacterium huguangmaarense]